MHISDEAIHPELRALGRLIRKLPLSYTPRTFRMGAALTKAADRLGIWPGKSPHRSAYRCPEKTAAHSR